MCVIRGYAEVFFLVSVLAGRLFTVYDVLVFGGELFFVQVYCLDDGAQVSLAFRCLYFIFNRCFIKKFLMARLVIAFILSLQLNTRVYRR